MGSITPNNNEFNLLSNFIEEALDLLGHNCNIYFIDGSIQETSADKVYYYDTPVPSSILFEDDLKDVKLKGKNWDKETDLDLFAYISLVDLKDISSGCIIEILPTFYNSASKFLVTNIFGQVDSTYARVRLVPYRESLRTSLDIEKDLSTEVESDGLILRKGYLKR